MAVKTIFIKTFEAFHDDIFMLLDDTDASFVLCKGCKQTHKVTADEAGELVKAITSFDVAKTIARMKNGMAVKAEDKVVRVAMNVAVDADPVTYTVFEVKVDTKPLKVWDACVLMQDKVIELPNGCIDDIVKTLVANGVERASTFGTFDKIEFVDVLPESCNSEKTVFVLNKDMDEDHLANTNWVYTEEAWTEFVDE